MNSNGEVLKNVFQFSNDKPGFNYFLQSILSCNESQIKIGLEATGHYGDNLISFLLSHQLEFMIFNPLITNMTRKSKSLRKTKNDRIDSKTIASMLVTVDFKPYAPLSYHMDELKSLSRHRYRIIGNQTKQKVQLTRLLTITFPEYANFFSSGHHIKTSYALLCRYSTPNEIIRASKNALLNIINKSSKGRFDMDKVNELRMLAKQSIGSKPFLSLEIKHTISNIRFLQSQIDAIDIRIKEIIQISNSINLLTIPGVSYISAAAILSEIGSIDNFENPAQLLAYAGLDPSIYQSGRYSANNTPMTKRGSKILRYFILNSAGIIVRLDPTFAKYHQKKLLEGKRYRTALSHSARKLIRIIFTLLKSNTTFETQS
jgi:transposase